METAIADTGFVVALLNRNDPQHRAVAAIYTQPQSIILPQTVLAEVAYLVGRDAGITTVIAFLQGLASCRLQLTPLISQDIERIAKVLQQYQDSRVDFVDASVMAIAELSLPSSALAVKSQIDRPIQSPAIAVAKARSPLIPKRSRADRLQS